MPKDSAYVAKTPDDAGHIFYTAEENAVWQDLYDQQMPFLPQCCAPEFLAGFERMDLPRNRVPQCADVSATLRDLTGWQVAPVPALIGFQKFFGMLAEKTFPAASFIRSRADFNYIKEPDIFHEIFGHTPLLTDARFAAFSAAIGRAGVTAETKDYSWLIRLYWFSIEFGLTKATDGVRALGSGLASSPTELRYAVGAGGTQPDLRRFDVMDVLRTPYRIDIHQPIYYVLDDVDDLFDLAETDLLAQVRAAQELGLFAPTYPPQTS